MRRITCIGNDASLQQSTAVEMQPDRKELAHTLVTIRVRIALGSIASQTLCSGAMVKQGGNVTAKTLQQAARPPLLR
jgi:hypothetical protein